MKTLYIDCTAGISGSRLIGALLDLKKEDADEFKRRMSCFVATAARGLSGRRAGTAGPASRRNRFRPAARISDSRK